MWNFQQQQNGYQHATIPGFIGSQATIDNTQNSNFNDRMFRKLRHETNTLKKWDMKCHCLGDKEVLQKLRVYWGIGTN